MTIEVDKYSSKLIEKLEALNLKKDTKVNILAIKKAMFYAKKYHADQTRESGEPFYSHPFAVAEIVADYIFDTEVIIIAIFHDIIEDTEVTEEMIRVWFGDRIAKGVERLTKIKQDKEISSAEMIEQMWIKNNKEELLIKLCDRFHNLQTINVKSYEKQKKILNETILTFLSFAQCIDVSELERSMIKSCLNIVSSHKNRIN